MIFKTLAVLALLALSCAEEDNIDEFIKEVFETPGAAAASSSAPPSSGLDSSQADQGPCDAKIAKCVRYYLCDYQYKSSDKEISELVQTSADSYCPSYLDVCCLLEAVLNQPSR